MSNEQWERVSRVMDFILKQPMEAAQDVRGKPEKKQRKPKKEKTEPCAKQLRMF